jgi:hypothetical protein
MAKFKQPQISDEVVVQAMKVAKATQKPGQTKEQTKLIALGIQKGIESYKKQHKAKVRQQDKQRKKTLISSASSDDETAEALVPEVNPVNWLPWLLLLLSWLGFALTYWLGLLS